MIKRHKVSRSGFYSWQARKSSIDAWDELALCVQCIWLESDKRFGSRFIKCFLLKKYQNVSLYRVQKCMRKLGIKGCTSYKTKRTTIPDKSAKPKPDLVKRDFTSLVPTYKLVGDITYLCTGPGWLYLSTVIDLNTRMVLVGQFQSI